MLELRDNKNLVKRDRLIGRTPVPETVNGGSTPSPATNTYEDTMEFTITPEAKEKIIYFAAKQKQSENMAAFFRVYVEAGGCSGLQYGFVFDKLYDTDAIIPVVAGCVQPCVVVIDAQSQQYLNGATLHYVEDFTGAGFSIQNPKATGSCGCGHSFYQ